MRGRAVVVGGLATDRALAQEAAPVTTPVDATQATLPRDATPAQEEPPTLDATVRGRAKGRSRGAVDVENKPGDLATVPRRTAAELLKAQARAGAAADT